MRQHQTADAPTLAKLRELAGQFRRAIELTDRKGMPTLEAFPRGSCGMASELLSEHLAAAGFSEVEYVCGELFFPGGDWTSHAWLEWQGMIVDITCDQFDHGPRVPVFVASESEWHRSMEETARHKSYPIADVAFWYHRVKQSLATMEAGDAP